MLPSMLTAGPASTLPVLVAGAEDWPATVMAPLFTKLPRLVQPLVLQALMSPVRTTPRTLRPVAAIEDVRLIVTSPLIVPVRSRPITPLLVELPVSAIADAVYVPSVF